MSDILILTASFGMGHKSVSGAIKESIQTESPELEVDIADMWEIINPKLREFSTKMYNNLTEYYPVVYNTLYDIKKTSKNNIIDSILCTTYYKKLYSFILKESPRVIISTFPLCSCFVTKIKKEFGLRTNLVTVITDVVDSWEWIYEGTNMYLVPSNGIKERMIQKGVDRNIIYVTGIPVKKTFMHSSNSGRRDTLLIVASGMTEWDITDKLIKKLSEIKKLKTIVVTGRNEKLYKKLSLKQYDNVQILGFVNNIDKLMDEAVFIVTKPGGVTLFEAINKELPLIIKDSGIGQEKGNIEFVRQNKLGIVIKSNKDLLNVIDDYIRNPNKANYLRGNIKNVKNALKTDEIVDCLLSEVI